MPDFSKRIDKAEKLLQKGRPDAALEEYLDILLEDPANEGVSHTAADLCVSLGRNADAVRLLSELFDRQFASGDRVRCAITYKKLAHITKPSGEHSLRFAQSLAKNSKDALKAYQSALQAFSAKGKKKEALQALNGIVELEPTAENLKNQGALAAQVGEDEIAGTAYLRAGELEQGEDEKFVFFEKAHKLSPNQQTAFAYADALFSRGKAEICVRVLEPFATADGADKKGRDLYGRALLLAGRTEEAAPIIWQAYERAPERINEVLQVVGALAAAEQLPMALAWARRLQQYEYKAGRRREFVALMKSFSDKLTPSVEFLEFVAEVFDSGNREHDYCDTLLKLFDLHFAAGNFTDAANCLDRAVEVDAYESGHHRRLEMLKGRVGAGHLRSIAERLGAVLGSATGGAAPEQQPQTSTFEDLIAQAQIYLRYSMMGKAKEKLAEISRLFPGAEAKSAELRDLYTVAGMQLELPVEVPARRWSDEPAPAADVTSAPTSPQTGAEALDEISRIAAITRNLYRQTSVQLVLLTAVNDLGRHWKAGRCIGVLCTPGKPPSIALEYCASGLKQSDIQSIVKMTALLQPLAVVHGTIEVSGPRKTKPAFKPLRKALTAVGLDGVLAVPIVDDGEHIGLLVVADCGQPRDWSEQDAELLRTMAEQIVLALHNVRLRRLVKDLAVTEEKSGLVKRSSYMDVLLAEVSRGLRQDKPLSVMLMNFGPASEVVKEVGQAGLEALMRHAAQLVSSNVRQNDVAVRYDASTIAVVLADTPERNAMMAADKLRKVAAVTNLPGHEGPPKIAIGVAEAVMRKDFDSADIVTEVANRAENALTRAVHGGENVTEVRTAPAAFRASA